MRGILEHDRHPQMPKKKSEIDSQAVTRDFFIEQFQLFEEKIIKKVDAKIEYSRKDAREQLESIAQRLNQKIDSVHSELKSVRSELKQDIHYTQVAVREVKGDTLRIDKKLAEHDVRFDRLENKMDQVIEKVDHHDEEIVFLKTAIAKN